MNWNFNLFNRASGVKLSPFKAWLSYFVDYTIPILLMKLFAFIFIVIIWAFRIGVIICAVHIILKFVK